MTFVPFQMLMLAVSFGKKRIPYYLAVFLSGCKRTHLPFSYSVCVTEDKIKATIKVTIPSCHQTHTTFAKMSLDNLTIFILKSGSEGERGED